MTGKLAQRSIFEFVQSWCAIPRIWRLFMIIVIAAFVIDLRELYEPVDFSAFYCGGLAVRQHLDPYQVNSLGACEYNTLAILHNPIAHNVVLPAPFPAYALWFFSLFTYFTPIAALTIWSILLVGAFYLSFACLRSVVKQPDVLFLAAMSAQFFMIALPLGQIVPFVVLAIAAVLYALKNERPILVGVASVASMLEPHVGLPLCLVVFCIAPRARLSMIFASAVLLGIWYNAMPQSTNLEYLKYVISDHAVSEAFNDDQYSLTQLLVLFGVELRHALTLGSLSYLVTLMLGCVAAVRIHRTTADICAAVIVAPTLVLLGGPFVHIQQMSIAVIAGLIAYDRTKQKIVAAALVALALPLGAMRSSADTCIFIVLAVIFAGVLFDLKQAEPIRRFALGIGAAAVGSELLLGAAAKGTISDQGYHQRALLYLQAHPFLHLHVTAEDTWMRLMILNSTSLGHITLVFHLITWIAIIVVVGSLYRLRQAV